MKPDTSEIADSDRGSKEESSSKEEDQYPHGLKLAAIILANMLAMFLVALDRTIIATAVPRISDEFKALNDIAWYAAAYLITSCATQLLWGRIFTFYPTKAVYLVAIFFFEVGSLLCGVAPNSTAFIVGRAIAGIGSAGIYSGSTILLTQVVPLARRAGFVGMMGGVFGIASVIAPLIGGAFTDRVTWRWSFYINLPVGAVSVLVLVFVLPASVVTEPISLKQQLVQLDPLGTLVFLPGIICLILALQWGGTEYPWSDGRVIGLFVLSGVLIIAFIGIQLWQKENATVPPRIFARRNVFSGALFAACIGGVLITFLYALPIWFQAIKNTSAMKSGIDTLPLVLSLVVGAIVSGAAINGMGYFNPVFFLCTIFMSVGGGLITTFTVSTGHSAWIGYQVLLGLGIGMGMQLGSLAAQVALDSKDIAVGISLMFFSQSLGGAIFVCLGQTLFTNALKSSLSTIPGLDAGLILMTGATNLRKFIPVEHLAEVLFDYNEALKKMLYVGLAAACMAILPSLAIEWRSVKGQEFVH